MNLSQNPYVWIAGGLVVGLWLLARKLPDIGQAVDPTSTDNLAYRAANAVGDVLTDGVDNNNFTLGDWIYSKVNPDDYAAIQQARGRQQ